MAVTPYLFRETTPGELETAINAVLVGILDQRILGVEVDAVQITPVYAKNIYTAVTTSTDGASTITHPYVFKTFAAATDGSARQLALNFMVANPTYFYSPIFAVYRPAVTDPNESTIVALIYNEDATEGADNWGYTGGGGGGGTISGTIDVDEVAVGTALDTIGGSAALTWTAAAGLSANRSAAAGNEMFGSGAGNTTMTGVNNTLVGRNAGTGITSATGCTAVGSGAFGGTLTVSSANSTAIGYNAMSSAAVASKGACTAVGANALAAVTASDNTAIGSNAGSSMTASQRTTSVGSAALIGPGGTVSDSTAVGYRALTACQAQQNTAVGSDAADSVTTSTRIVAMGYNALGAGTTGVSDSTAIGFQALLLCTVSENTAIGSGAADALTTSTNVTAVGYNALGTGSTQITDCTAVGRAALAACTGDDNTAVGANACLLLTSSARNVAVGDEALGFSTTGVNDNTAIGHHSLRLCDGTQNVAVGSFASLSLTSSSRTTAVGYAALDAGSTGISDSTAIGYNALTACTVAEITAIGSGAADALTTSLRVTAVGYNALGTGTTGLTDSTAVGHSALALATGANNTAIGALAGDAITSGASNTLVGAYAGSGIIGGTFNCAIGDNALFTCSSGVSNAALGAYALYSVSTGSNNMGIGTNAGSNLSTANNNVAVGYGALQYATTDAQVAIGMEALRGDLVPANNTGTFNVSIGFQSMRVNAAGAENVAIGYQAMIANTAGSRCVAIGLGALVAHTTGTDNTALGWSAGSLMTSGSGNIFLGAGAGDSTDPTATGRMVVGSDLAYIGDIFFGNGEVNASTGGVVIQVTGGLGADKDGGNLYIAGGKATGSGTPGLLAFQTSVPAASSSTPQSLETRIQLDDGGAVAGNTCMLLWDVDHGTLQRVTLGANDSGGAGFRVLRVPN